MSIGGNEPQFRVPVLTMPIFVFLVLPTSHVKILFGRNIRKSSFRNM